jgi:hypothetical protein
MLLQAGLGKSAWGRVFLQKMFQSPSCDDGLRQCKGRGQPMDGWHVLGGSLFDPFPE